MKINWDKWFKPLLCIAALIYILTMVIPLVVGVGFLAGLVAFGGVEIVSDDTVFEAPSTIDCSKWNTTMHIGNDFDPNYSIADTGFEPSVQINITPEHIDTVEILDNIQWTGSYEDMQEIDLYMTSTGSVIDFSNIRKYIESQNSTGNETFIIVVENAGYWSDKHE